MRQEDEERFEAIWKTLRPALKGRAAALVESLDDADDLVQEVGWARARRLATGEAVDPVAWAGRLLYWRALDLLRQRRKFVHLVPENLSPSGEQSADSHVALRQAIARLPRRQRDVIEAELIGHSTQEIAAKLGITEATVRSLKRFARHNLSELLSEEERT